MVKIILLHNVIIILIRYPVHFNMLEVITFLKVLCGTVFHLRYDRMFVKN